MLLKISNEHIYIMDKIKIKLKLKIRVRVGVYNLSGTSWIEH